MPSVEALVESWEGETTLIHRDPTTGAHIIIAVHSSRLGTPSGGTRMKHYASLAEAVHDAHNLARGMTHKLALAGLQRGGGKGVIALPTAFDPAARPGLLRRYGALLKQLGGFFETGPDVGTSDRDMDVIAETGAPHVFCRTVEAGGSCDTGPATALGVFYGIQAACERAFGAPALKGRIVLVQGAGSVGRPLIGHLTTAGATVLVSDVDEQALAAVLREGIERIDPEAVFDTDCDIFAPCALGGALNRETIPRLRCRAVAGGANNQLATPDDAERLRARGILYAPDFAINIGGAMVAVLMEREGHSRAAAEARLESIGDTLRRIFQVADEEGVSTEAAARRIVERRLAGSRV